MQRGITRKQFLTAWRERWNTAAANLRPLRLQARNGLGWLLPAVLFDGDELPAPAGWALADAGSEAPGIEDLPERLDAVVLPLAEGFSCLERGRRDLQLLGAYSAAQGVPAADDPGFFTTRPLMEARHPAVLELIESLAAASAWARSHPAPAAQLAAARTGESIPRLEAEIVNRRLSFLPAAVLRMKWESPAGGAENGPDAYSSGPSWKLPRQWETVIYDGSSNTPTAP